MHLERLRIVRYGPFHDLELELLTPVGEPRLLTVLYGEGGTGRSTVIDAIAHTRPGKAVPLAPHRRHDADESYAVCEWRLGQEDPRRPHPLSVVSPNLRPTSEDDTLRRREQTYFDRMAAHEPGFVFIEIPSQRYFSRASLGLNDPARTMTRYDARASVGSGTDASRPDLTRPCKQALAYAGITLALATQAASGEYDQAEILGRAMHAAVNELAELTGHHYLGLEPRTLEPVFETPGGLVVGFDDLPNQLRHAIAFAAIPIQTAWAAHHGQDPQHAECVVAIDDFELFLGPSLLGGLFGALARALPRAQWLLTTSAPHAAALVDADSLVTLRRAPESDHVLVYSGQLAVTH